MGKTPTRAWRTRHTGILTGVLAPLRAIFDELGEFLARPTFLNGIEVGDGTAPIKDPDTGVIVQPPTRVINAVTLDQPPQSVLDELQALADRATDLETNPIDGTRITDDSIETRQLAANAVTAENLAAINLSVGKYIESATYVPGASGWAIDGDGTAEFNDAIIRGSLEAGEVVSSRVAFTEYVQGSAPPDDTNPYDNNAVVWTRPNDPNVAEVKLQKTDGLPLNIYSSDGIQCYGGDLYQYGYLNVIPEDLVGGLNVFDGARTWLDGPLQVNETAVIVGDASTQGNMSVGTDAVDKTLTVYGNIYMQGGGFFATGPGDHAFRKITYEKMILDATGGIVFNHNFPQGHLRLLHGQGFYQGASNEALPLKFEYIDGVQVKFSGGVAGRRCRATFDISQNPITWA